MSVSWFHCPGGPIYKVKSVDRRERWIVHTTLKLGKKDVEVHSGHEKTSYHLAV